MEYVIDHPDFKTHKIILIAGSVFRRAKVSQDGTIIPRKLVILKGLNKYAVMDDKGNPRELVLKFRIYDPIPKITMDGIEIIVAKKLKWYEYVWSCLPLIMVFGGGLGALIGLIASFSNVNVLRKDKPTPYRYGISGAITVLAFVVFSVLATEINAKFSDPTSEAALSKIANTYNKSLPKMINGEIQLTSLAGLEKELVYNFRFVNSDSDSVLLEKIPQMRQTMIGNDCSTADVYNDFLKKGIKVESRYYDKNNVHLTDVDVSLSDCQ